MPPRNLRRSKSSFLVPLALTATAAAASFALWYLYTDDNGETTRVDPGTTTSHGSGNEGRGGSGDPRGRRGRDRTSRSGPPPPSSSTGSRNNTSTSTRDVPRSAAAAPPPPPSAASGVANMNKPSIALVVSESSSLSSLLSHLPSPLNLSRAHVFILIHSPSLPTHPLSGSGASTDGRVYQQARKLFPADVPKEMVMPYTDRKSLVPMLKQIAPEVVFIEGDLVEAEGEVVEGNGTGAALGTVKGCLDGKWVGNLVVAVEATQEGERVGERVEHEGKRFGRRCRVLGVEEVGAEWGARAG